MTQQPAAGSRVLSQQQLEQLLQAALVPVEPSQQFLHRLKARLVDFRQRGPSGWVVVAAAGTILVFIGATFAVGLRLILIAVGVVSVLTAGRGRRG
jgi:hypothetical protein